MITKLHLVFSLRFIGSWITSIWLFPPKESEEVLAQCFMIITTNKGIDSSTFIIIHQHETEFPDDRDMALRGNGFRHIYISSQTSSLRSVLDSRTLNMFCSIFFFTLTQDKCYFKRCLFFRIGLYILYIFYIYFFIFYTFFQFFIFKIHHVEQMETKITVWNTRFGNAN